MKWYCGQSEKGILGKTAVETVFFFTLAGHVLLLLVGTQFCEITDYHLPEIPDT